MSDLISRKEAINKIMYGNSISIVDRTKLEQRLNEIPPAYDVENVMEQLEKYQTEYSSGLGVFIDELVDRVLINAIDIVRKGGIDE